ncbi:MAG TPA: hypothetical protein VMY37_31080 [Thermoguttaceae bacterium]|nr:hypothetical protein [Thermoguttaceae bacterium]
MSGCLAVVVLVLTIGGATGAEDRSSDQRFLSGLRQRHLFALAESHCTTRLEDPQLADARRVELVIELSLTLADWAVNSAPDDREPLWQRALAVTEDFAQKHPDNPQLLLVRLQGALGLLARGELAREEAPLVAQGEALLEQARTSLGAAIRSLQQLGEEAEDQLRAGNRPGRGAVGRDDGDRLTAYQLASLADNIRYQLARAYRNRAQCYPPDSPDWANSLTLAVETLDPLAKQDTTHPLAWKSRIDEIVCYRLLADHATAQRRLEALSSASPPPAVAVRARAEQIRLALAANRLNEAVQMLAGGRQLEGVGSGELDYAFLETYLAAWRAANESGDEGQTAAWQAKANEMLALIRGADGPYWTRRAQMLLSRYVQALPGGDLAMWVQAAENAYHSGQYNDALAAYDRARTLAEQQGDEDRAFQLGFTAATIEHDRGRHQEAMSRYHALSKAMPGHPKAPESHLLAIFHAGQLARQQPSGSLDRYASLAQEHLATWPNASTADEARRSLGFALDSQGEWQKAIEQYQAISPDHPKFGEVVAAVARAYEAWLEERRTRGEPTAEIAASAAGWFETLIVGPGGRLPERWSPLDRQAAMEAARFRLNYTTQDADRAERILAAALEKTEDSTPEWQSTARALLVFSLAAQGRRHEATTMLGQISEGSPEQLLKMLQGLARIGAASGAEVKAELAGLELSVVELLRSRREELDASARRTLDSIAAQALADAGKTDAALDAFGRLAQAHPQDGEIQEGYARLLLTRQDAAALEAALAQWREVEKKSRPGSDRWFRARLAVALLHYQSNNQGQAEKILRLLEVLHPEPKLRDREVTVRFAESLGPTMRARLIELLDSCQR